MGFELERADGVRDAFDPVADRVGKVVHRVDAPLVASAMVRAMLDAVDDRVAHVHVRACEVDLGTEALFAIGVLAVAHFVEELHVLFDAAIAVGARAAGLAGIVAAVFLHFVASQIFDISLAHFNHLFGKGVNLVVVVACEKFFFPFKAEPLHVFADGIDVFHIFLGRVRVVEAEVRKAAELLGSAEVQADGLGMANVNVAVRFGRETRQHVIALAGLEVVNDNVLNKIRRFGDFHNRVLLKFYGRNLENRRETRDERREEIVAI